MSARLTILIAALLAGCASAPLHPAERAAFRAQLLCPDDRQTVVERSDLLLETWACADIDRWSLEMDGAVPEYERTAAIARVRAHCVAVPPHAIAIDPERLALWHTTRDDFYTAFGLPVQISGCGEQRFYVARTRCTSGGRHGPYCRPEAHELGPPPTTQQPSR